MKHSTVLPRGVSVRTTLHSLLALVVIPSQQKENVDADATCYLFLPRKDGEDTCSRINSGQRRNPMFSCAISKASMFDCIEVGSINPTQVCFLCPKHATAVASLPLFHFFPCASIPLLRFLPSPPLPCIGSIATVHVLIVQVAWSRALVPLRIGEDKGGIPFSNRSESVVKRSLNRTEPIG